MRAAASRALQAALYRLGVSWVKRPRLDGTHLVAIEDIKVLLDFSQQTHSRIYNVGTFEPELSRVIERAARSGDVFIDIGANFGWHSLRLLTRRPDVAASYAFEPSRKSLSWLEAGIRANGLDGRVVPRQVALGKQPGRVTLKHFKGLGMVNSSTYHLADWPCEEESVEMCTLDSIVASLPKAPALVKCDVEGGERDVLEGATELLSGRFGDPPIWFLEANYETSGMAGHWPWELVDIARAHASYRGYVIRNGLVTEMAGPRTLRHGDTLILAIPELHATRLL